MSTYFQACVEENQEIAPGAYVLSFSRSFDFEAGQVIGISLETDMEPRLYSIASGNKSTMVEILYTVNPGGLLTPSLSRLRRGDRFFHTAPFGKFTSAAGPALWIATGTGIAPFVSMLCSGLGKEKTLVYGNRTHHELYFFDRLHAGFPSGRFFPCTSREVSADTFHGRVTDFIRLHPELAADLPCHLCGSAEMVVDVRDLLIGMGVAFDRIFAEIFF